MQRNACAFPSLRISVRAFLTASLKIRREGFLSWSDCRAAKQSVIQRKDAMIRTIRCGLGIFLVGLGVALQLSAGTFYVNAVEGCDDYDGESADAPFATIQKAIDVAADGDKILVCDGVYSAIVCDNKPLIIESVNGPVGAIIDGGGTNRCATLGTNSEFNTLVCGLTFKDGRVVDGHGGGTSGGTISNCIYSSNHANYGGGAYGGKICKSIFINNVAEGYGGGAYGADIFECVLTNNVSGTYGGGAYAGIISNSLLICNTSKTGGGGCYDGVIYNSRVEGNSVTSNYYGGGVGGRSTAYDCVITNNTAPDGGGSGRFTNLIRCTVVGNRAMGVGGGSFDSCLQDCLVANNIAEGRGGGAFFGNATNCIFTCNESGESGGGAYEVELVNCTVALNSAKEKSGGVRFGQVINSIVYHNFAEGATSDVYQATVKYSCASDANLSDGNINADPQFVDITTNDFHLLPGSPCLNAGTNFTFQSEGLDVEGNRRVRDGFVDMGAYEHDIDGLAGVVVRTPTGGVVSPMAGCVKAGGELVFAAMSPRPLVGFYTNGVFATAEKVFAWKNITEDGVLEAKFDLAKSCTIYVDGKNGDDEFGMSEALPTRTIGKALEYAYDGDTIMVADGVYSPIVIEDRAIRVESVNGPERTIIDGRGIRRCATLVPLSEFDVRNCTNVVLVGFTLRNGRAMFGSDGEMNPDSGGAVIGGTLENCIIEGSAASWMGGGAAFSTLSDCDIGYNSALYGGGAFLCQLTNCRVMHNRVQYDGGGCHASQAYNCVLAFNFASRSGGGASSGTLYNCTIANNEAVVSGGGSLEGYLYNTIIWGNSAGDFPVESGASLAYCCTDRQVDGVGNIVGNPLFVDPENEDFTIGGESSCINAGNNDLVFTLTDCAGHVRIVGGAVDIGAFEYETPLDPSGEKSFESVWGAWSIENDVDFSFPVELNDWDSIARFAWRARDKFVTSAAVGLLPPSSVPIVISLGSFSHSGSLSSLSGETVRMDMEMGVPVWHVRISEDPRRGFFKAMVGDVEVRSVALPTYDADRWVEAIYGTPPMWLSADDLAEWYASRSRCRIELFLTLVPSDRFAEFCSRRESDEKLIAPEDENKVLLRGILPNVSTNQFHVLNVRTPADDIVNFLGTADLTNSNWNIKGVGAFPKGRSSAGVSADGEKHFFKVVPGTGDGDSDGLSDVVEGLYGTDPGKADTSGGGIPDGEKLFRYELNPMVTDTDGDGYDDDEEIALGQDPTTVTPGASVTIRYVYDDDDRLTGTYFGSNGRSTTQLSPAGNPLTIEKKGAK